MASSSRNEIAREIRIAVETEGLSEIRRGIRRTLAEMTEYGKSIAPSDPSDGNALHYQDGWRSSVRGGRGRRPWGRLSNIDPKARLIEDGTGLELGDRPQGGMSPAWHVFARIAARWGGTTDDRGGDE